LKTIAIIGAMELEVAELKSKMKDIAATKAAGMEFFTGKLAEQNAVLVKCGIGKVNAAVCAQTLINLFKADCIINTGVAGAISKELDIGDVVISSDCMQHDFDTSAIGDPIGVVCGLGVDSFAADEQLIAAAQKAGKEILGEKHNLFVGRIATGDQFIGTKEQKQRIESLFGGMCAEMEGGAIAQVCFLNKIPFVVARAISDKADEKSPMSFEKFLSFAAKNSADIVLKMLEIAGRDGFFI